MAGFVLLLPPLWFALQDFGLAFGRQPLKHQQPQLKQSNIRPHSAASELTLGNKCQQPTLKSCAGMCVGSIAERGGTLYMRQLPPPPATLYVFRKQNCTTSLHPKHAPSSPHACQLLSLPRRCRNTGWHPDSLERQLPHSRVVHL